MSEEIYKEYLNDWMESDLENKKKVNEKYTIECVTVLQKNINKGFDHDALAGLSVYSFNLFDRAPKKQIINGIEVIAPRFDIPTTEQCYWVNLGYTQTFQTYDAASLSDKEKLVLSKNGWFDNLNDVVDYADALTKQD